MKKVVLTFLLIQGIVRLTAQTNEIVLSKLNDYNQLTNFIKNNTKYIGSAIHTNSITDSTALFQQLFKLDSGKTITINDTTYKVVNKKSGIFNKFSYIYLDGKYYTKSKADSTREDIIQLYKMGYSFRKLASMYNMDGNKTGELNWIPKGVMVKTVEDALDQHIPNDVFFVDTPELNWYHVIRKESNALQGLEISVFWIKKISK